MVSRRLPTAAARIRAQVRSCEVCRGQSGAGAGFLRVFRFHLPILISQTIPHSLSFIIRDWYNRPIIGRRTKWTHSVSSHPKKLKEKFEFNFPNFLLITVLIFFIYDKTSVLRDYFTFGIRCHVVW
jgi:hypothetical protein